MRTGPSALARTRAVRTCVRTGYGRDNTFRGKVPASENLVKMKFFKNHVWTNRGIAPYVKKVSTLSPIGVYTTLYRVKDRFVGSSI